MIILDSEQVCIGIAGKTKEKAFVYVFAQVDDKIKAITHEVAAFTGYPTNGPNMVIPIDGTAAPEQILYEQLQAHKGVWWDVKVSVRQTAQDKEIKDLKEENFRRNMEITTLRERARLLEKDIKELTEKLNAPGPSEQNLKDLDTQINAGLMKITALSDRNKELESELEEAKSTIETLTEHRDALRKYHYAADALHAIVQNILPAVEKIGETDTNYTWPAKELREAENALCTAYEDLPSEAMHDK